MGIQLIARFFCNLLELCARLDLQNPFCFVLDVFDWLLAVDKSRERRESNPGSAGWELWKLPLCYATLQGSLQCRKCSLPRTAIGSQIALLTKLRGNIFQMKGNIPKTFSAFLPLSSQLNSAQPAKPFFEPDKIPRIKPGRIRHSSV